DVGELGHRRADTLHFLRPHVLEHLGGFRLTERQQQDRGTLGAAAAGLPPVGSLTHPGLPSRAPPARLASGPGRRACVPARAVARATASSPPPSAPPAARAA